MILPGLVFCLVAQLTPIGQSQLSFDMRYIRIIGVIVQPIRYVVDLMELKHRRACPIYCPPRKCYPARMSLKSATTSSIRATRRQNVTMLHAAAAEITIRQSHASVLVVLPLGAP
jgi:hypothetical protein